MLARLKSLIYAENTPVEQPQRPPSLRMQDLEEATKYTPDYWKLCQYYFQNVFICDSQMYGCSQHNQLLAGNSKRHFSCFTQQKLVMMQSGAFVAKMEVEEDQIFGKNSVFGETAHILGQFYSVRPDTIRKLDMHYQNTVMFKRKRIKFTVSYRERDGRSVSERKFETISGWAYMANQEHWVEKFRNNETRPVSVYQNHDLRSDRLMRYYYYVEKREKLKTV